MTGAPVARSAIVTGGASGIGRALAEQLAAAGVRVVLADRQADLAARVAAEMRSAGGAVSAAELDVRDAARFAALVRETVAQAGRLDYLFNNAGIAVGGEAHEFTAADWDDVIDVNLRGVAHGILAAYPLMIRQGFGHIVNTASIAGLLPAPMQISYAATKHAVVGLSRVLRVEARRHGVRVSVLCPSAIRTPILAGGVFGRFTAGVDRAELAARIEQFRPMDPALFARRALRAVARNRFLVIEPRLWRLAWYVDRMAPRLVDAIAGRLLRQVAR